MPPRKFYVDSNIFFYARILDRKYGVACSKILEQLVAKKFEGVISLLVFLEVGNALHKYRLKKEVASTIGAIASLPLVTYIFDMHVLQEAVNIHTQEDISIYDCVHAATMKQAKTTHILSADHDFDRIRGITRIDPLESPGLFDF